MILASSNALETMMKQSNIECAKVNADDVISDEMLLSQGKNLYLIQLDDASSEICRIQFWEKMRNYSLAGACTICNELASLNDKDEKLYSAIKDIFGSINNSNFVNVSGNKVLINAGWNTNQLISCVFTAFVILIASVLIPSIKRTTRLYTVLCPVYHRSTHRTARRWSSGHLQQTIKDMPKINGQDRKGLLACRSPGTLCCLNCT